MAHPVEITSQFSIGRSKQLGITTLWGVMSDKTTWQMAVTAVSAMFGLCVTGFFFLAGDVSAARSERLRQISEVRGEMYTSFSSISEKIDAYIERNNADHTDILKMLTHIERNN